MSNLNENDTNEFNNSDDLTPDTTELDALIKTQGQAPTENEEGETAKAVAIIAQADYLQTHTRYLKRADALHLATEAVGREVGRGRFDERWASTPLFTTLSDARRLVRAQRIKKHAAALEMIYESTCAQLAEAGLDFGVLMAWNNGERGQ